MKYGLILLATALMTGCQKSDLEVCIDNSYPAEVDRYSLEPPRDGMTQTEIKNYARERSAFWCSRNLGGK